MGKNWKHKNATEKFDYMAIADRKLIENSTRLSTPVRWLHVVISTDCNKSVCNRCEATVGDVYEFLLFS